MYTSLTLSSQEERGLVLFHGDSCELISISSQDYDIDFNSVQTKKKNQKTGVLERPADLQEQGRDSCGKWAVMCETFYFSH